MSERSRSGGGDARRSRQSRRAPSGLGGEPACGRGMRGAGSGSAPSSRPADRDARPLSGRTNVQFVHADGRHDARARLGARAGETPSSGSSAVAVAAALVAAGACASPVTVRMPGGSLEVRLENGRATLIGPAEEICHGEVLIRSKTGHLQGVSRSPRMRSMIRRVLALVVCGLVVAGVAAAAECARSRAASRCVSRSTGSGCLGPKRVSSASRAPSSSSVRVA